MCKPTETQPPCEDKDVSAKEKQPVAEPLKRYEILDLSKPEPVIVTKPLVPAVVQGRSTAKASGSVTEGQAIMILLVALLVVAAMGVGAIIAIHAMRS